MAGPPHQNAQTGYMMSCRENVTKTPRTLSSHIVISGFTEAEDRERLVRVAVCLGPVPSVDHQLQVREGGGQGQQEVLYPGTPEWEHAVLGPGHHVLYRPVHLAVQYLYKTPSMI